jgi:hypothetical protein
MMPPTPPSRNPSISTGVAVEKRHAARGRFFVLVVGWPLAFVLVVIPQDGPLNARANKLAFRADPEN